MSASLNCVMSLFQSSRRIRLTITSIKRCPVRPFTLDVVRADTAYVREPKVLGGRSIKKQ